MNTENIVRFLFPEKHRYHYVFLGLFWVAFLVLSLIRLQVECKKVQKSAKKCKKVQKSGYVFLSAGFQKEEFCF